MQTADPSYKNNALSFIVSRCSRWLKTCINSVKMLVGNKKYAEEFISNAGVNNIQNPPQRAGSTMQGMITGSLYPFHVLFL